MWMKGYIVMSRYDWGGTNPPIEKLKDSVEAARQKVISHPLYHELKTKDAVVTFIQVGGVRGDHQPRFRRAGQAVGRHSREYPERCHALGQRTPACGKQRARAERIARRARNET
jgi:hypothetical protein